MTHESLIADDVIAHLELKPHAEGGWFRETFRDAEGHEGRAHSTAILFLLKAGEVSRWHRVDADEVFHWVRRGAARAQGLGRRDAARTPARIHLLAGEHPHGLVPANAWKTARGLGA